MIGKIKKDDLLQSVSKLPVLSEVVTRAMNLIDDPNCSIRELTDILSKDQSLSAKIIKLANSAFYGFSRKIHSLSEAFIILGFKTVRSLLITASVSDVLKGPLEGYVITKGELWRHSYAVAYTAGNIAKTVKKPVMDAAFTAGILHDIGKLILGNYLKGSYQEILKISQNNNICLSEAEEQSLGYNHATVGGMVLDYWNFPEVLVNAVANHHKKIENNDFDQLTGILYLSDGWVLQKGIGLAQNEPPSEVNGFMQKAMGLSDEFKDSIIRNLDAELIMMSDIFFEDKSGVKLSYMPEGEGNKKKIKAF